MKQNLPKTTKHLLASLSLATWFALTPQIQAQTPTANHIPTQRVVTNLVGENDSQLVLTAIPPRLGDDNTLRGNPGETIQKTIRIKNTSQKPVRVTSSAIDFIIGEDGQTPVPISSADDQANRWSLASWITLVPNTQVLQPNETRAINLVIDIPQNALAGGHYAMITHQPDFNLSPTTTDKAQPNTVTGVNQRVGTLVYLVVNGDINEDVMIREFKFPDFSELGPIPFSFTLENLSDVHIRPNMKVEIKNIFGQTVTNIPVETRNIFPLSSKEFQGLWDQIWGYGRYTAILSVTYGDHGKTTIATTHFWFFPATLVIAGVIILLVLLAMAIAIRRHLIHRKESEAKRIAELEAQLAEMEKKSE